MKSGLGGGGKSPGMGGMMKGSESKGTPENSFGFGGMIKKGVSAMQNGFGKSSPSSSSGMNTESNGSFRTSEGNANQMNTFSKAKGSEGPGFGLNSSPKFGSGQNMRPGSNMPPSKGSFGMPKTAGVGTDGLKGSMPKSPTPGGQSSFGFGGMKMPSKTSNDMKSTPKFGSGPDSSPGSNLPQSKGSFGVTNKSSSFGGPMSNSPSMRASEVSNVLSSLADEDSQRMQSGRPGRAAMPSPIGELNLDSSSRNSGSKPGPDTLLGSLASGPGGQQGFNPNNRPRVGGPNYNMNGPDNGGVQSGGNTVGGFKPLSVTITDPRTGKKRTISVSSMSDTEE